VSFRVDAFPSEAFTGTVQQVRLQPTTVQNVVTYQTVINVPNQQMKLKPGMTANVQIEITRKNNVLRMPVAATRFRPTAEVFAALKQEPPPDFGRGGSGRRNAGGTVGGQGGFPGGGQPSATAPTTGGAPAAAVTGAQGSKPTQQATVSPQPAQAQSQGQGQGRRRQGEGSQAEAQGGGDRPTSNGAPTNGGGQGGTQGGGRGGFNGGGGRGGFDPNMTPEQREERRKRMEERMASMTPEERAAFQEKMAQRQAQGGGRGGFGGGQSQDGQGQASQGQGGGGQGQANARTGNSNQSAANQGTAGKGPTRTSRLDSAPTLSTTATTIDSLFGPLPVEESRGQAWLYENKQLKQVRLRLGISDGTNVEVLDANPELREGTEIVTNVIIDTGTASTPGQNNNNNPLLGPQRGRGGPGGFGGPGGGGGGGGRGGR
jgi:hypothetical protein